MTPAKQKELKAEIETRNKSDDKFRRTARELTKASDLNTAAQLRLFTENFDALSAVRSQNDDLLAVLAEQRAGLARRLDEQLERRREDLLSAAEEAGRRAVRRQDYDHVDCFKITYRQTRVTLELGSEKLGAFDETDGRRVFDRVMDARSKLDGFPFSRDAFFDTMKDAISTAKAKELGRGGKIPIRKLYPLVVVERQLRDQAFIKQPTASRFSDYSICQFIYDLARFGKSGWIGSRGERICSQTPNMRTIAGRGAVALPSLDGRGPNVQNQQIAVLWIGRA